MMLYRYIPILRWKRGERVGVQHLSAAGRNDVVPFFVVGTDQYVGRKATRHHAAIAPPDVFADELASIWGKAPFYLDAVALPAHPNVPHPLVAIAASARNRGLNLIPATTLGAPASYQAAVATVIQLDRRGVALRVDLAQFSSASTWAPGWGLGPANTDLIVDFANNVGNVNALGAALYPSFSGLHLANQWRTVTMAGTSMPDTFQGYAAGQHLIDRIERNLWLRLSGLGLTYRLHYGDYATVSNSPAPSGIQWGYPINVKYTLENQFLICRGVNTTGQGAVDMDAQLIGHAKNIVAYPNRMPLANCWGDTKIDRIASGTDTPQGLEHWVQIGVNRHIEITRHYLP